MATITNPYEPCRGKGIYDGLRAWDEFNEAEHPRAPEGEHGGQFVAKGGSSSSGGKESKTSHLEAAHADREQWPEHVKKLRIPPAWTDVKISHNPDADLQATGRDKAGRPQYVYSEKFAKTQSALKFARVASLQKDKAMIEDQLAKIKREGSRSMVNHADCANLIMKMGIRPGSDTDTKAKVKAYGATTLEGKHVVEEGGQVYLRFTGKKGVNLNLPVESKSLANNLLTRARKAGYDGRLFGDVRDGSLLDFVHRELDHGNMKTKDMRTLLAADLAQGAIKKIDPPKNEKEYKKRVLEVAKQVAGRLGNTPTVALQSYIPPMVFSEWRSAI